jgi:hypothetical protein
MTLAVTMCHCTPGYRCMIPGSRHRKGCPCGAFTEPALRLFAWVGGKPMTSRAIRRYLARRFGGPGRRFSSRVPLAYRFNLRSAVLTAPAGLAWGVRQIEVYIREQLSRAGE